MIAKPLMRFFSFAMLGGLEKYKSIEAEDVALAMAEAARLDKTGIYILHYSQIREMAEAHQEKP